MKKRIMGILLVLCLLLGTVAIGVPVAAENTPGKMLKCVLGTSSNTSLTHYGQLRTPTFAITSGKTYDVSFDYYLDGSINGGMDLASKCYVFMCSDARGDIGHIADSSNNNLTYFTSNERRHFTASYTAATTRSDARIALRFLYDGNLYLSNFSVVEHGASTNLVTNGNFSNGLTGYYYIGGGQQGTFGTTAAGDFADIYQVVSFGAPLGEGTSGGQDGQPDANLPVYHVTTDAVYATLYSTSLQVLYLKTAEAHTLGISFDYYLISGTQQVQNASNGKFTDGAKLVTDSTTGSAVLQGGVHHFSGTVTTTGSTTGENVGYALGISTRETVSEYYIWNMVYTVDGTEYKASDFNKPSGVTWEKTTYGAVFSGQGGEDPETPGDPAEPDASTAVYHITTEAVYGTLYSTDLSVLYLKTTAAHTFTISFDYYLISGVQQVQNASGGKFTDGTKLVADSTTGSAMLQGGVHHFSGTVTTAGSTTGENVGYALGISTRETVSEYYIWNMVYTLDGVKYEASHFFVPTGITLKTTTYGEVFSGQGGEDPETPDEPSLDSPAYQIDFNNHTATNGYPVVVFTLNYKAKGAKVSVSFDYYLPQAIPQTMMKNVASGRDLTDSETGTHLLQQGVHHFSFSDSSFDNDCFSPGVQMGNIAYSNIYIWNYKASFNGAAQLPKVHINDAPVYEITYGEIPFEGTSKIQSVDGTTVTMKAQTDFEYSKDGMTFQESNVFENLEYDVKYTFYSRKVGTAEAGVGSVVLIPSAPVVQKGATRLLFAKHDGYEYSLDGEKWTSANGFGSLPTNKTYTVYQRLLVKGTVYPVASAGTTVCTNGHDHLPNDASSALSLIKSAILTGQNDLAVDVNEDGAADVRDLVNHKKRLAGLLIDEYDSVPANIRAFLDEAKFYNTEDYTYTYSDKYVKGYIRPDAINLTYTVGNAQNATSAQIAVSANADMSDPQIFTFSASQAKSGTVTASVYHLFVGAKYYWQATVNYTGGSTETSLITPFMVQDGVRFINVASVNNMRDVGGWKTADGKQVKQGLVYRSAHLDDISAADKDLLLNQFGIRYDIDLRRTDENGNMTASPLGSTVGYLNVPSNNYGSYFSDPEKAALVFSKFASLDNYPMVFHCVGGADRTGTLAVMLKALLGVEENDLAIDFELTPGRLRKRGEGSDAWIDYPGLMTAFKALPGDTLQEKAYGFYHDKAKMSAMELANIYNIMMTDSAVFQNESLAVKTVSAGANATFKLDLRQSGGIKTVTVGGTAADYSLTGDTLTVKNVTGSGLVGGTITLNDGAQLNFEINVN